MNGEPKDGGPAYPMVLRDWFAGQALSGWMADPDISLQSAEDYQYIANVCYRLADAMLAERDKGAKKSLADMYA